jgi:hypothetical protein
MEAASTSETAVNFYQTTRCNRQEDNHLCVRCGPQVYFPFNSETFLRRRMSVNGSNVGARSPSRRHGTCEVHERENLWGMGVCRQVLSISYVELRV